MLPQINSSLAQLGESSSDSSWQSYSPSQMSAALIHPSLWHSKWLSAHPNDVVWFLQLFSSSPEAQSTMSSHFYLDGMQVSLHLDHLFALTVNRPANEASIVQVHSKWTKTLEPTGSTSTSVHLTDWNHISQRWKVSNTELPNQMDYFRVSWSSWRGWRYQPKVEIRSYLDGRGIQGATAGSSCLYRRCQPFQCGWRTWTKPPRTCRALGQPLRATSRPYAKRVIHVTHMKPRSGAKLMQVELGRLKVKHY